MNISHKSICLIALSIVLSACIGGRSAMPDYHLLTARATPATTTPTNTITIGVGPVHVAQFLNRPQIVTHAGGVALQLNDSQRWGEPLEQGIQRVLMQNISTLTGAETRNFPWRQNLTPDYAVRIEVADLDQLKDGAVLLDVSWALEDLKNAHIIKTQQEQLRGNGSGSLAESYSNLLAELAQHITAQLPK
ncbi:MAG: rane integrity-associated transporter subunit PqiC [Verrucomicrobiaceae bacterium]|nr:rane integrity-associated transporter subunit PqiC [Verrucomicrobiaceae bacterium]